MQEKCPAFEIDLVMAGAVSASAYSSGVIDFLIEALDNWYQQKQIQQQLRGEDYSQWEIPSNDVIIKAISGTSAGAITAAVAAAFLFDEITPVTQEPGEQPVNNKFYEAWVQKIDISEFLKTRDLADPKAKLLSILDFSILDAIGKDIISCLNNHLVNNWLLRNSLNSLWNFNRGMLVKRIRAYIEDKLKKHGQL